MRRLDSAAGQRVVAGREAGYRAWGPGIFPALRQAGYDGWVSFEYETPEPEESGIPRSLAYLKRMMA